MDESTKEAAKPKPGEKQIPLRLVRAKVKSESHINNVHYKVDQLVDVPQDLVDQHTGFEFIGFVDEIEAELKAKAEAEAAKSAPPPAPEAKA